MSGGKSDVPQIFDRALLWERRRRLVARAGQGGGNVPDFLLQHVCDDICERLSFVQRTFASALVAGALNGVAGRALIERCGVSKVVDVEPVAGLRAQCSGEPVAGDEEALPVQGEAFDLAISALALQFVNDLPGALAQIRRALKPDGLFVGVILGGATLRELREAMLMAEGELTGGASPRVAPFADVRDAGGLLQRAGFALPVSDAETVTVSYASALDLMRELKAMGATNVLHERSRVPMTRGLLFRAAEIYGARFGGDDGRVPATFEFVTVTGWAPDESQQKPLRPGSARVRLADALGVAEVPAGEAVGPGEGDGGDD